MDSDNNKYPGAHFGTALGGSGGVGEGCGGKRHTLFDINPAIAVVTSHCNHYLNLDQSMPQLV